MKINGIDLSYCMTGEGPPLVLIAGLGGDQTFWTSSLKYLSKFKVITFDCRGGGMSTLSPPPYTMELFADDLAALLDSLKIERCHILGFSMGGNIAQAFTLKYPERVDKLILAATFASMNRQARLFVDAVLSVYENGCTPKQMFDLIAPWLFSENFLKRPESASYLRFDENDPNHQPLVNWKGQYLAQREFDARGRLRLIQSPTLVIAASEDRLAHLADAKMLSDLIKGARLEVMSGVGHLMNFEEPENFHGMVIEFLK
jgi:pimeloyl-ACP methyl ester carboxylesterase